MFTVKRQQVDGLVKIPPADRILLDELSYAKHYSLNDEVTLSDISTIHQYS